MTVAVREISATPSLGPLYARALAGVALGALPVRVPLLGGGRPDPGAGLPQDEVVQRDVAIDPAHVAAFADVCGFAVRDALPLPYLHLAAFAPSVALMADPGFPLPLLGLVHVGNRIVQHRALTAADRPTLRVRLADLRAHRRGRIFDALTTAEVDGQVVWEERSSYLARGAGDVEQAEQHVRDESQDEARDDQTGGPAREAPAGAGALWHVAGDVGRRYAAVSGDRNPIHLSALTARLFGFPRPIAHGMWSASRCIAAVEHRLPEAVAVEVAFRKPLLLPARAAFSSTPDGAAFTLRDARTGALYAEGTATPG